MIANLKKHFYTFFKDNKKVNTIVIVCIANYCRSPVAEKILKEYFITRKKINNYNFISAGLNPMHSSDMDARSRKFLNTLKIEPGIHNPQILTRKMMAEAKIIFALDTKILSILNKKYSKHKKKIKLLGYLEEDKIIKDPYRMNEIDYNKVMMQIDEACKKLIL